MAGWEVAQQHSFTVPGGGRGEAGYWDVSSGSDTVEVPTLLNTCYYGQGTADTDPTTGIPYQTITFTTDCSISAAGAITFARRGGYRDQDVRFRYFVIGW